MVTFYYHITTSGVISHQSFGRCAQLCLTSQSMDAFHLYTWLLLCLYVCGAIWWAVMKQIMERWKRFAIMQQLSKQSATVHARRMCSSAFHRWLHTLYLYRRINAMQVCYSTCRLPCSRMLISCKHVILKICELHHDIVFECLWLSAGLCIYVTRW